MLEQFRKMYYHEPINHGLATPRYR